MRFFAKVYKNEIEVKGDASDAEGKGLRRLNCFLSDKKEDLKAYISVLFVLSANNRPKRPVFHLSCKYSDFSGLIVD